MSEWCTKTDIGPVPQGFDKERQDSRAIRGFDIFLGPFFRGVGVRRDKAERGAKVAPVGGGEFPEVHADRFAEAREANERFEIKTGVIERLGAREFERLATIGFDLALDAFRRGLSDDVFGIGDAAEMESERDDLHIVPRTVVIFRGRFFAAVFARGDPFVVRREPACHRGGVCGGPSRRARDEGEPIDEIAQMARLENADAASVVYAGNGLGVF